MLWMLARAVAFRRPWQARAHGRGLWTGRPQSGTDNRKPLEGVRILDLTRVLAGPFATMNLGDLGAEVIKVERPGAGDDTRTWGPPFVNTESTYFLSVNRNKKSIAVNIKDPRGARIVKELAATCDVFVENYVPGKLSEMGLGYEDIDKIAPHIIYCSITGYGQTGPMSQRAGYDAVASAMSGLMHITGPEDGDPVRPGVAMTDLATGLFAYGAIMAGLIQRYRTGKGLFIDCNLLSSQAFKTKDGYLVVGAGNNQQFAVVCKILNLPELIDDSKYRTNHLRVQNRKELVKILSSRFAEEVTAKWLCLFEGSGIPYGPINSMKDVFSDAQILLKSLFINIFVVPCIFHQEQSYQSKRAKCSEHCHMRAMRMRETFLLEVRVWALMAKVCRSKLKCVHSWSRWQGISPSPLGLRFPELGQVLHNGLVMEMNHPTVGKISVPGPAVRYSKFKMSEAKPPPLLGQHTRHILKEVLRYDDGAIEELLGTGVIEQHETK
ncbi:succinate--hydroxymethylglutarate CoA-transferase isoform X4 [Meriones unguiculatus]|uniref:succinate--hydroxymethylglutarate CoA-transferase isoform X4 n=1 Tax=Meriones unguiculatus TaxID=10047 RepID=UPI00293F0B36|nr:succinate--hydroxymethylglutarate CoA-transferase isoform X4 [Meriones unguiculatus]